MKINFFKALTAVGTVMEQAAEAAADGDISLSEIAKGGATVAKLSGLPINTDYLELGSEVLTLLDAAKVKNLNAQSLRAIIVPAINAGIAAAIKEALEQVAE